GARLATPARPDSPGGPVRAPPRAGRRDARPRRQRRADGGVDARAPPRVRRVDAAGRGGDRPQGRRRRLGDGPTASRAVARALTPVRAGRPRPWPGPGWPPPPPAPSRRRGRAGRRFLPGPPPARRTAPARDGGT